MRLLALMSMLLLLTVVCSVAGLARMVGMPLGGEVVFGILMLTALVGGLGIALFVAPKMQVFPVQVGP